MMVNTTVDTAINQATISPALASLDDSTLNLIASFVNDCNDAPVATKNTIIGILNRIPPRTINTGYSIPDGAIIADFYIPYLCCSDSPAAAYVLPATTPPAPPKPVITMATTFCDNDAKAEPITVSQPGGTFNTVPGLDGTKLTFTPQTAKAGTFQIIYTVNNVASDPVTVTVLPTPANTFTFTTSVKGDSPYLEITATFVPDVQNSSFKYQWQFGTGFNITSSTDESPQLTAFFDSREQGGPIDTTASLTVTNGSCSLPAVTKNLIISGNGLYEAPTNAGSILSGIKNLFNKKG
jgi:hypothetical protein